MGIPFLISAVLIDQLKEAFKWIKNHYDVINRISGTLLIIVGIMMTFGVFDRVFAILN